MGDSPFETVNMKQARRLLRAITDLARESSLTGSLDKGARLGIIHYNGLVEHFEMAGVIPPGLFVKLSGDDHTFDDLGVACALLTAYIEEEDLNPPPPPPPPSHMIIHSDSQELRELRELRDVLRERLPER